MWYAVSLLFKSTHTSRPELDFLWEESIVLVNADSEEEASKEAIKIGKEAEQEFTVLDDVVKKDTVKWTFEQIERVYLIQDENLKNGIELFSRFLRDSEVKSILTPFED